jgi:hypothetical protein
MAFLQPADDPPEGEVIDIGEGPLGYPVLEVGAPAPDRRVEPTQEVRERAMSVPAGQQSDLRLDRSE